MKWVLRISFQSLALLFVLFFCTYPSSPPIFADGGAPNLAYVAGTPAGVSVIDVGQAKVTHTIAVGGNPSMVLLSLDGRYLYAAQPALGQVATIAAKTGQTLCAAHLADHPSLLAFGPAASVLYAAGSGAANVSALNPETCQVVQTIKTNAPVYGLWMTTSESLGATNGQLWVAGPTSISVFDVQGSLLDAIPIAGGPQFLCIPNGGSNAYVTTRQGSVDAIDIKTLKVRQLLTGGVYGPMDYDALTFEVYVPDELHKLIDVLTPTDFGSSIVPQEPVRTLSTADVPESVAITNNGLLAFVALKPGKVAMYDLIDRELAFTVSVGGTPRFIITGLYPPSFVAPPTPKITPSQAINIVDIAIFAAIALVSILCFSVLYLLLFRMRTQSKPR